MLLTLTLTGVDPATDLGFLLHKHPDRVQSFEVSAGQAEVFYPVADPARCTAALAVELDPIALVRRRGGDAGFALGQYVNDRPYAASSMLAVALGKVFRTAMSGRCDSRPELAARPLPLSVEVFAVPTAEGAELVRRLFEPLGWRVAAEVVPADPRIPSWGPSRYVNLTLTGTVRLADALTQLYVLLPVLDDTKHYWVGDAEVEKLLRAGESWLPRHPDRELIARRYLAHQRSLVGSAYERLLAGDDIAEDTIAAEDATAPEDTEAADGAPARRPLRDERVRAILDALRATDARTVVDLGCGEGRLVSALLADRAYDKVVGVDVSPRTLEAAARRLRVERMSERQAERVAFFQSSLTYRDDRLRGFDAGVLSEVVEHLDPERLPALEANVFGYLRPGTVVVTTPNAEYNERYESLTGQGFRHRDHRFEWTRDEFAAWTDRIARAYAYTATIIGVGEPDDRLGSPTQAAIFRANDQSDQSAPTDAAREVAA